MINAGEIRTKREPVYYLSDENIKQIADLYRYGEKYTGTMTDDETVIEDIVRDVAVEDLLKALCLIDGTIVLMTKKLLTYGI